MPGAANRAFEALRAMLNTAPMGRAWRACPRRLRQHRHEPEAGRRALSQPGVTRTSRCGAGQAPRGTPVAGGGAAPAHLDRRAALRSTQPAMGRDRHVGRRRRQCPPRYLGARTGGCSPRTSLRHGSTRSGSVLARKPDCTGCASMTPATLGRPGCHERGRADHGGAAARTPAAAVVGTLARGR